MPDPDAARRARNVFVIHGRDERLRERFYEFLRAIDLRPLEWETLVTATDDTAPTLLMVVQTALSQAQAVVVLLAPEDVVQLHPDLRDERDARTETARMMQARPNVLIELGMALMRSPKRTIIVEVGELRPVADLGGLNVVHLDRSGVALGKLVQRLKVAGCSVDDSGADWRDHRRFVDLVAHDRQPD